MTKIAGLFPLTERLTNLFRTPTVAALARFIIDHETQPGQAEKIAEIFLRVEAMSDAGCCAPSKMTETRSAMAERSKNGALAAARRKLLTRLLDKSGIDLSAGRARAEPARGEGALSFAQERLWFLDQLHPDSPVYNISRALRLTGRLDTDALERAVNEIVGAMKFSARPFPA